MPTPPRLHEDLTAVYLASQPTARPSPIRHTKLHRQGGTAGWPSSGFKEASSNELIIIIRDASRAGVHVQKFKFFAHPFGSPPRAASSNARCMPMHQFARTVAKSPSPFDLLPL
ncbi:hypothetical protein A6X21_08580 [Planctopirus hydrillae]|uniref:Uncharacterized protein n=1 Tax=Planctopirus hydrillae TaxID=1841610 RepID=A0A1C3E8E5_9PLAN|nr:hypothetical protein A6X21_08580 [Planctopirus hydrillae]